ncbi:uncharacterized protein KQ657_001401 [Scheffersomyces spartinae]|uniref:Uncharacterized protein n=1 Tax=Scheffersomyces spartinae TaxID=45513 RepID=A0A9P8AIB5_9ASCO|nr:uncharacterized protein KQ657_001401 [Scheffersomyces spartinae]KAG7192944.1 hypothetical protein KQ657_001401 [Scheffersomyces spartinae]
MSDNLSYLLSVPGFRQSRLSSLYSSFTKLKDINPEGYQANLTAWTHLIPHLIKDKRLNVTGHSLMLLDWTSVVSSVTLPDLGPPKELLLVFKTLVQDEAIVPLSWFKLKGLQRDPWYTKLTLWFTQPTIQWEKEPFVSVNELKIKSQNAYHEHVRRGDKILYSKHELLALLKDYDVSDMDLHLLLVHWSKDLGYCVVEGDYIKFGDGPITEWEKSVIDLDRQHLILQLQISDVEAKIKGIDFDIKLIVIDYKKDEIVKLKVTNLLHLKHLLRKSLSKYLETSKLIQNLQTTLKEASTNLDLVSILETSNKALKSLNSHVDLKRLADLKDDVEENIDRSNQISEIMMNMTEPNDDQEIEDELQNLVDEQEAIEKKKQDEAIERLGKLTLNGVGDVNDINETNEDKDDIVTTNNSTQLLTEL